MAPAAAPPPTDRGAAAVEAWVAEAFARGADGRAARPHQVDAVTRLLLACAAHDGARPLNFLLQHSAGSGKSLTIAALALGLATLVGGADGGGGGDRVGDRGGDRGIDGREGGSGDAAAPPAFGAVLIVNDRLQLDAQLGDTVAAFLAGARRARGSPAVVLVDVGVALARRGGVGQHEGLGI